MHAASRLEVEVVGIAVTRGSVIDTARGKVALGGRVLRQCALGLSLRKLE